jgi:tetratricopeptide (TPR) repeat protein
MRAFPEYLIITIFLFLVSCRNGEIKKASLQQKEEDIEDLIDLSDMYYQLDMHVEALNIFNKIIDIDSTRGDVFYRRGYCRAWLFDFDGSTQDYLKSIELDHRIEDSYFSIGTNYAAVFNDSMAIKFFSKALELNPHNEKAKRELRNCKIRLGIIET